MAERDPPSWLAGPLAEIRAALAGIDDAALERMSPAERRLVESSRSAIRTYDASGLRGAKAEQVLVDEATRFDATGELDDISGPITDWGVDPIRTPGEKLRGGPGDG